MRRNGIGIFESKQNGLLASTQMSWRRYTGKWKVLYARRVQQAVKVNQYDSQSK